MNEDMFRSISDRIPDGYDWSVKYNGIYVSSLENYKVQFYEQQMVKIIGGQEEALLLFDYEVHRPENCKGTAQNFLIYEHLYYHFLQEQFSNNQTNQQPPSLITYVEGKPGTGKGFLPGRYAT